MGSLGNDKTDGRRSYTRPAIRLVLIDSDDELLQGVIETSGSPGPGVDPDHPDDPDSPDLVGHGSVWDANDHE